MRCGKSDCLTQRFHSSFTLSPCCCLFVSAWGWSLARGSDLQYKSPLLAQSDTIRLLDRLLAPYYPSVCMSVFISACWHVAQSVNTDRRRDGAKNTHTPVSLCVAHAHAHANAHSQMHTRVRAHSGVHADAHTHTHAYTGYVVHNLCSVTWISLASVKAAARAHASTEHAAGKASSQCARQMTEDTWASSHVHKTAQIKANFYVPDSTHFPPFIFQTFLKLLESIGA